MAGGRGFTTSGSGCARISGRGRRCRTGSRPVLRGIRGGVVRARRERHPEAGPGGATLLATGRRGRALVRYLRQTGLPQPGLRGGDPARRRRLAAPRPVVRGALRPGAPSEPGNDTGPWMLLTEIRARSTLWRAWTPTGSSGRCCRSAGGAAHQRLPARRGRGGAAVRLVQVRPGRGGRAARAETDVRDLGVQPRVEVCTCASATWLAANCAGPTGGRTHRGPWPGQGADRQERRHSADGRQGRLRRRSDFPTRPSTATPGGPGVACYRTSAVSWT